LHDTRSESRFRFSTPKIGAGFRPRVSSALDGVRHYACTPLRSPVDRCACLEGFEGPRCQQTQISFNGRGWAWYPPLDQCLHSHTSLEIITSHDDGLILYFGPLDDESDNGRAEDFLLLELRGGYPVLRVNQGSGEARLATDGRDRKGRIRQRKLSNGHWHRLDIFIAAQVYNVLTCEQY